MSSTYGSEKISGYFAALPPDVRKGYAFPIQ